VCFAHVTPLGQLAINLISIFCCPESRTSFYFSAKILVKLPCAMVVWNMQQFFSQDQLHKDIASVRASSFMRKYFTEIPCTIPQLFCFLLVTTSSIWHVIILKSIYKGQYIKWKEKKHFVCVS